MQTRSLSWMILALLVAGAASLSAQVPQNLYYKFNENTGTTTANEASPGVGNPNGTISGATTWGAAQLGASSMSFNASQMPTGWTPTLGTGSWTVEFWLNVASGQFGYVCGDNTAASWRMFTAGAAGTTGITMRGGGMSNVDIPGAVDGTWHHIAIVHDDPANTITSYLDGVQVTQLTAQNPSITGTDQFYIGGYIAAGTSGMVGRLDDFRFWSTARTAAEIQANRNIELSGSVPTLLPATGSGFSSTLTYAAAVNAPLSLATLVANDGNSTNIDATITAISAAPGVTQPANQSGTAVPFNLTWTGTPTAVGSYSYNVNLNDGTNSPNFTVTINVTDPGPTLVPATGSGFNASLVFNSGLGAPLANATLTANDVNSTTISYTVTAIAGDPGITPPANQSNIAVPTNLSFTGTASGPGTFTYQVNMTDGTNNTNFTVTIFVAYLEVAFGTVNTGNTIPFNQTSIRYQNSYGPTELNLPANTFIQQIRVAGTFLATAPTFNGLRLRMAHSSLAVNALTNTYTDNSGPLSTVIGPVDYTPAMEPISGSTTVQWYVFNLTTPFLYNGVDALLLDWSYDSRTGTGFSVSTTVPTGEQARSRAYTTTGNWQSTTTTTVSTTGGNYGVRISYSGPPANSVVMSATTAASGLATPQNDVPVMSLAASASTTSRTLSSITVTKSGTVSDAAVTQVRLYIDNNGDRLVDVGDTLVATGTFTLGESTLTPSPSVTVPDVGFSAPIKLIVAASFASAVPAGSTLSFSIDSAADVTLSGGTDISPYPLTSATLTQRMSGTYTINQTSGDFTDIGDAFDALETLGVSGPVVLSITDSATYVADPSYSLGMNSETTATLQALTPVPGASSTNTITLRAAVGQTPKVEGSATGAILFKSSATAAQTGRGGLVINQSYVTVEGIEVFGGPHFGIMAQGNNTTGVVLNTTDITIRRCIVRDIPSGPGIAFMGLLSGYATNFLVEHNFVYNCLTASIAATPALQTLTNGSITVRNNQNPTVGAAIVRHNTVVHTSTLAGTAGIYFYSSSTSYALADVSNNIVVMSSTTLPALHLGSTALTPQIADFNYWFATVHCNQATLATFALWQGTGRDANGSNANPQLLSTSAPFDLRLSPASPCIDPTGQTSTANIDIFGTTRPQGTAVDIGAHEANWVTSLFASANTAGPANVTSALTTDQWVGSYNALSVLSIQQVNSVMFTHVGTTGNGSFTNLKLWIDANANGVFDGADVQLGSTVASLTGSTVTFSGTPLAAFTAQNQSATLFLTAQIAASATLGTAQFQVTASTDVSASPGPVAGSFPIVGAAVNIVNPAPTLVPATGSGFNASRVITVIINQALTDATLSAEDANNPTIAITVVGTTPAPGVTQPSNSASAAVPANLAWTGTPTSLGTFTYDVTLSDGINSPSFSVTINVINPAPTLLPGTGSAFNLSRQYTGQQGVPLANAVLTANDANDPTVAITITAVSAAPGVTQPSNNAAATVPFDITWTGTPTTVGNYTYTVNINDGTNSTNFTVTIVVTNPPATLVPATGSAFNASRVYAGLQNVALANAVLTADDANDPTVAITITAVSAAPGVTQPADNAAASVPFNLTWTGTPTAVGNYSYTVNINDGTNSTNFTVTINVTNPVPTLVPATGSAFNAARTYAGLKNTALANAVLTANDVNEPTVAITITAVTAAPGVTQPANNAAATVPFDLTWTGTPTSHGTFTYTVTVSDGVNTPQNFTVTFNIAHPALSGTYTISQTLAADFTNIGEAFDVLETAGVTGAVILEIIDSATYVATPAYSLGINSETVPASQTLTPVSGASSTNTITLRAATGQTPRVQGSASGAILYKYTTTTAQTGRGGLVINQSFVTVEGLEVFDGPDFGIMTQGNSSSVGLSNSDITIRRCTVHSIPNGPGIAFMGMNGGYATNYLVEHNYVYNCLTVAIAATPLLQTFTNGSITVRNAQDPLLGGAIVRHNTVVHNSTVAGSAGIFFYSSSTNYPVADLSNNVVVVTSASIPAISMETLTHAPQVANRNIWFAGTHSNQATLSTFALWQGAGFDANGSNADPLLVSTTAPFDLDLQDSSPAIDLATGSGATVDIYGNTRPAGRAADSGAHEAQVPEIEVLQATSTVTYNTNFNVGNVPTTTGSTFTFTIENNGVTDLTLSGTPIVQATIISNLDAGSGVTVQPSSTTVAAAGSVTFDVFLDPTIDLAFSLSISIANNDADRAPFIFTIQGTGFTPNGNAEADPATGSSFTGGTNGPFDMAVNPGAVLANASIELTDPEADNITVTAIVAPATVPTGITAPAIPAVGQPLTLTWTGTADASNAPGDYTWEVTFQDAGNGTPVTVFVTITINDIPPAHVILNATGGNGGGGNPYTAFWTETQNAGAVIDMATVTDANTSQILSLGTIVPGGANPVGGSGFTITLSAGMLSASPTAALVAADVGVYTFNVEVTDGTNTVNVHLSLTVSAAPNITTVSPLTDGEQGVSYTALQFVATGGTGALTWTVTGGALPSGMTLSAAGLFSGIPTLAGIYNFDVTATDTNAVADTTAFAITIDPPAAGAPAITTTSPLTGGIVGNAYGPVTITAAGGTPGYTFSVTTGTLPAGLTMSAAGVISGTPSVQGTSVFNVTVTDAAFATDTDTFSITIVSTPTSNGGGGGGGGGGGCVAEGSNNTTLWGLLLGVPALLYLARRRRAARN